MERFVHIGAISVITIPWQVLKSSPPSQGGCQAFPVPVRPVRAVRPLTRMFPSYPAAGQQI